MHENILKVINRRFCEIDLNLKTSNQINLKLFFQKLKWKRNEKMENYFNNFVKEFFKLFADNKMSISQENYPFYFNLWK